MKYSNCQQNDDLIISNLEFFLQNLLKKILNRRMYYVFIVAKEKKGTLRFSLINLSLYYL